MAEASSGEEHTDAFSSELDEYDLLSPEAVSAAQEAPQTDLSTTAKAFNKKIQIKKKAQEIESEQAEKNARARHTLMLRAMMNIRKSLRDLIRIDLGERFHLYLTNDDFLGWPRLTIKLVDSSASEREYLPLVVTAHDRYDSAVVEIAYSEIDSPEKISLVKNVDLQRLPNLLRKCVRAYLDYVGDIVIKSAKGTQHLQLSAEKYLSKKTIDEFFETASSASSSPLNADIFSEDYQEDFLETLPHLQEVELLPELKSSGNNKAVGKTKSRAGE